MRASCSFCSREGSSSFVVSRSWAGRFVASPLPRTIPQVRPFEALRVGTPHTADLSRGQRSRDRRCCVVLPHARRGTQRRMAGRRQSPSWRHRPTVDKVDGPVPGRPLALWLPTWSPPHGAPSRTSGSAGLVGSSTSGRRRPETCTERIGRSRTWTGIGHKAFRRMLAPRGGPSDNARTR